jgi:uncharacterized protein YndB with AHSA1/START domain
MPEPFHVAEIEFSFAVLAPIARVWQVLTQESKHWWPADFATSPKTKGFLIQPKLGGFAFEDFGDGTGFVWYTVIGVDAPNKLMLQGLLTAAFGGPATTIVEIELEAAGDAATTFHLSDTIFGRIKSEKADLTEQGWRQIFEIGFKSYIEQSKS